MLKLEVQYLFIDLKTAASRIKESQDCFWESFGSEA
jgi:hypothetical protein